MKEERKSHKELGRVVPSDISKTTIVMNARRKQGVWTGENSQANSSPLTGCPFATMRGKVLG